MGANDKKTERDGTAGHRLAGATDDGMTAGIGRRLLGVVMGYGGVATGS